MKRLVICCDGTWNRPENENVTNIEKIARSIESDRSRCANVQQLVQYVGGVGANWYWLDRVLGGAFGLGLFAHVTAAYRFLALNYETGDEIFVLGFSRGAYTARSLVGMIGRIGLLTGDALIEDKLPEAVNRYRRVSPKGRGFGSSDAEFKRDHCHAAPVLQFLGVFDTVGALGVPGALSRRHRFHDVRLSPAVLCARQALAIDERRIKFEPCLWEDEGTSDDAGRVKQVWFEGVHSDVGGGYEATGLSDTALLWMVQEAHRQGLVFDTQRLDVYCGCGSSPERHTTLNLGYRMLNLVGMARNALKRNPRFRGSWRVLDAPGSRDLLLASSAREHWEAGEAYAPDNIARWAAALGGDLSAVTEPVIALPEPRGLVVDLLAMRGTDLSEPREETLDGSRRHQTAEH